jgi:radical SAM superfamily enzyme with C-terminal helix-hairpin-helix motif
MQSFSIIDGYVDQPTCLGVPPYISPYPRYITGAIYDVNPTSTITYHTIDQIRNNNDLLKSMNSQDMVIIITGVSVPGKYLAGYPASPRELTFIASRLLKPVTFLCGPGVKYGFGAFGGKKPLKVKDTSFFDLYISGDPEIVIHDFLRKNGDIDTVDTTKCRTHASEISSYAVKGASIVSQHPYFPHRLITEIETYRGCSRSISGGCSFCCEPLKGSPDFRSPEEIINEINTLYTQGIRHIRLGSQPCLFSYMATQADTLEYPIPNPEVIDTLFTGIRSVAPDLKTFHIDNVNPGIVARYPEESRQIINTIIKHHTPGDVAAFGVESVDPVVIAQNNLKANEEEIFQAIRLFNKYGKTPGYNGLPELLPGLNFVFGLKGESKNTYHLNYAFLKKIMDTGLLIRRINLRQVIPLPGTPMEQIGTRIIQRHASTFQSFKHKVKTTIEQPLLIQLIPPFTILTDVMMEKWKGKHSFGRQIGSYPILIGISGKLPLQEFYDIVVVDYGYRSVTGFPTPFFINTYPREAIESLPGIGKKRTIRILRHRPFFSPDEFLGIFDYPEQVQRIMEYLSFEDEKIHEHQL